VESKISIWFEDHNTSNPQGTRRCPNCEREQVRGWD